MNYICVFAKEGKILEGLFLSQMYMIMTLCYQFRLSMYIVSANILNNKRVKIRNRTGELYVKSGKKIYF